MIFSCFFSLLLWFIYLKWRITNTKQLFKQHWYKTLEHFRRLLFCIFKHSIIDLYVNSINSNEQNFKQNYILENMWWNLEFMANTNRTANPFGRREKREEIFTFFLKQERTEIRSTPDSLILLTGMKQDSLRNCIVFVLICTPWLNLTFTFTSKYSCDAWSLCTNHRLSRLHALQHILWEKWFCDCAQRSVNVREGSCVCVCAFHGKCRNSNQIYRYSIIRVNESVTRYKPMTSRKV